ncbi:MAG: polymerase sigma factor RpoE [Polyangiaceae bacterium]|jgi:RNA polymerase sigma-70 factor (ECF subfamily)|nr:polymerase sigma factor RpoE [Polyangiaceae bacterium]
MDQKTVPEPPCLDVDEPEASHAPASLPASASFPEIFEQQAQFLWRTLMNLGVPRHDAQDLCQEVMITVHRRLPDFDGRSLRGWLYGICVRVASDYRRSARVRREVPTEPLPDRAEDASQLDELHRARELRRTLEALDSLDEGKRAAFVLYEVEELTLAEVSEALEVPLQTVYSRIKSAREALRSKLDSPEARKGGVREAG